MMQPTINKWLYIIGKISQGTYNSTAILLATAIILFSKDLAIASTLITQTSNNNQQRQVEANLPFGGLMPKLDQAIKDLSLIHISEPTRLD